MDKEKKESVSIKMVSATATAIESPVFKVQNNKDYILYGEGNDYPSVLLEMMNQSSLHNAILKKKADMTASQGFEVENVEQKSFVSNINGSDTLDQIAYKNGYDLALYGGYCYLATWSKDKKKIARIQYIDWSKVRKVKELDDDSEMAIRQSQGVDFFMVSSDWTQEKKEKYKPEVIQGFSTEFNDATTQLVYVPMYSPNSEDVYPLPDYQACSVYIAIDTEIASYHLNSCKNGFLPGMMINLIGVPSDEEMQKFEKKLQESYKGSSNASKIFLTVSEDESQVPVITPIEPNSSDERYKDLATQVKEQIIIGHRASNEVVGVAVAGKLGASSEVIEAEAMFQHNVINGYQSLIEDSYTRIMNFNGIEGDLKLEQSVTYEIDELEGEAEAGKTNITPESIDVVGADEETLKAQAGLRGSVGGVTGILGIQESVSLGTTSRESAVTILIEVYGFTRKIAESLLGSVEKVDTNTEKNE